jgi:esterase
MGSRLAWPAPLAARRRLRRIVYAPRCVSFLLSHFVIGEPGAPKLGFLLHGALGAGHNLRSIAQKLVKLRPDYRLVLPDLRHHGGSQGAPPPDTLEACALDLRALASALGATPSVVIGHSFGGKVALMLASLGEDLEQVWVLDSNPGPQDPTANPEVLRVIEAVRRTTRGAKDRKTIVHELVEQGLSSGTANWLATNLKLEGDGYVFALDLDAIETLMRDYFSVDLWPVIDTPAGGATYHLVVAEQSDRWAQPNRERLHAAARNPRTPLHVVPNAGHWLHVDNPAYLLSLLSENLG